jgi:hypothetical protein
MLLDAKHLRGTADVPEHTVVLLTKAQSGHGHSDRFREAVIASFDISMKTTTDLSRRHPMQRTRIAIFALAVAFLTSSAFAQTRKLPPVEVYKNPSCGCCGKWVEHMQKAGFTVTVHEVPNLPTHRERLGIPAAHASCHSAKVGSYALEGHVPADDVKRLLREKPRAIGLAVPGMPAGSPGMEVPPGLAKSYATLLLRHDAPAEVYVQHPAGGQ